MAYKDLVGELGAYDVDSQDTLTIINEQPAFGQLTLEPVSRAVPSDQDCTQPSSGDVESPTIPCGLELPHNRVSTSCILDIGNDKGPLSWIHSSINFCLA